MGLSPWFGNVILGAVDLTATAGRLRDLGLDVQDGGTHPAFGTRNMIVPLGRSYLELLTVEDRARAEQSLFGRTLLARTADGDRLVRWSIRTDRIDEVAAELDLHESTVSRAVADKTVLLPDRTIEPLARFFGSSGGLDAELRRLLESSSERVSDQRLAELLSAAGHPVARRTVAKHRARLGYAATALR